jgi:hypothetical protein
VRIEHVWAAPDAGNLGFGIDQISSTHYWTVDGLWPAGTAFHAKVDYDGLDTTDLDHDLFGVTEEGALLVYRPDTASDWQIWPEQTLHANILTNGVGSIDIDSLAKGQYAFAKGSGVAGIPAVGQGVEALRLFPVPAHDRLVLAGSSLPAGTLGLEVYGSDGRLVLRAVRRSEPGADLALDVAALDPGTYVLVARTLQGGWAARGNFVVAR